MDFCKWVKHADRNICEICGFETKISNAIRVCKKPPSLLEKIGNFIPALTNHILTGSRKCSQEELESRLTICKACPLYFTNDNGKTGVCGHDSCGCSIKDTQTFFNKLYWADQTCPLNKWGPIASSGV